MLILATKSDAEYIEAAVEVVVVYIGDGRENGVSGKLKTITRESVYLLISQNNLSSSLLVP